MEVGRKDNTMAKVIMVQGTMSNAGKSIIVAALCRVLKQDGYRVAPFKSQNMALNSFITKDGLEMGRAQVMQAQAAGAEPDVAMNPILLKPTNEVGSQVIVNGEVLGNMSAREYFAYKKKLIPDIMAAYHKLEQKYDVIVVEGAGSPAEINLKQDDIVNMGLAKLLDAPVLLVGDIDRGGVFAQLLGTMLLLEPEEQARVKGLIVNKFRGDKTILNPGIEMLEERAKVPVVGVMPYLQVDMEDEDSLSERFYHGNTEGLIDIAVIRLPHISNFTDFMMLEHYPHINLHYVNRVRELGNPDMVILPGTKNTMADLKWLRESGMEAALLKAKEKGCILFGICGGYQMLGRLVEDPEGAEEGGALRGLGLLPMKTVLTKEKIRCQVKGEFSVGDGLLKGLNHLPIEGYEIHMGITSPVTEEDGLGEAPETEEDKLGEAPAAFTQIMRLRERTKPADCTTIPDGAYRDDVYGSYVHGILDGEETIRRLAQLLAKKKGISIEQEEMHSLEAYREQQFDLLADAFRKHCDMNMIYGILQG